MRSPKAKGFTLVEILVALFVFVILMAAVSQIFVSAFTGYRNARIVQNDLQSAQHLLNTMAKMLRTSTVISSESSSTDRVKFYDYSQDLCVEYIIDSGTRSIAVANAPADLEECESQSFPAWGYVPLTLGNVTGVFSVMPSESGASKRVGRVTVSLQIQEGDTHVARIQSSTSLRDYGNIGW